MNRIRSFSVKKFLKKHRYAFAAFFLPILILTAAFGITGIYPFGGNQITIIDMYHQYVPFLAELQYKLQHGGSLLYSWDGAAGFNFWNLLAYYGASPLNLLLALFPAGLIVEGVTFVLMLKVGFSGMFQYLYLKRTYPRNASLPGTGRASDNWGTVAFGTMYALSAYFLGYFWCIMWIDVMALLPLCILGLRRLVDEGRPRMYCIALALIIFCNYYIALMMCIFIVLYYLVIYFEKARPGGAKQFVRTTAYVAFCSLTGAAMACVMFIPTWIGMKNAYYYADEMPEDWSLYHDPLEIVNQLLPNAHTCIRDGLPNLSCGLFVVIMLILYFVSRTINIRTKVANGMLLAAMFFSLNVNKLDFIWHGLHFPNELPFRYSFVVSFVIVGLGYQAYIRLPQAPRKTIIAALAGILGYYFLAARILSDAVDSKTVFFYLGTGFLVIYGAVLLLGRHGILTGRSFSGLLAFVVAVEMLCSCVVAFDRAGNVERQDYLSDRKAVESLLDETRGEFVRVERLDETLMNMPALYSYPGVSQFASCLNANATELMEAIGVEGNPGNNRYNYVPTTPVINAMLNVKYLLSGDGTTADSHFVLKDQNDECTLYENTQPLSIGYMLPEDIRHWDTSDVDPFVVQDDFIKNATGGMVGGVFEAVTDPEAESEEMTIDSNDGSVVDVTGGEGIQGMVTVRYTAEKAGDHYVFCEADQAETIEVFREDGTFTSLREDVGAVVYIGDLAKDESVEIQVTYQQDGQGSITSHVARLDEEKWDTAYALMSKNLMKVTDFGDTFIEGRIHADRDGIFTTSVLYEDGWRLYVDGEKVEPDALIGGDFIGTSLRAGDHTIKLKYTPDGFITGLILTILGIIVLIALEFIRQLREYRRKKEEAVRGDVQDLQRLISSENTDFISPEGI